jgi:small subunit ribosomal protein S7
MSRRNVAKKRFTNPDPVYNSYLVSLLIARILYSGKKTLAQRIVIDAFEIVKKNTESEPLAIFEKAVKNTSPLVEVKSRRVGGSNYQVPIEVSDLRSTNLALRSLIKSARERSGKTIAIKLANELIDASNNTGNAVRKKEEMHRMAEANKAFAHFRY